MCIFLPTLWKTVLQKLFDHISWSSSVTVMIYIYYNRFPQQLESQRSGDTEDDHEMWSNHRGKVLIFKIYCVEYLLKIRIFKIVFLEYFENHSIQQNWDNHSKYSTLHALNIQIFNRYSTRVCFEYLPFPPVHTNRFKRTYVYIIHTYMHIHFQACAGNETYNKIN